MLGLLLDRYLDDGVQSSGPLLNSRARYWNIVCYVFIIEDALAPTRGALVLLVYFIEALCCHLFLRRNRDLKGWIHGEGREPGLLFLLSLGGRDKAERLEILSGLIDYTGRCLARLLLPLDPGHGQVVTLQIWRLLNFSVLRSLFDVEEWRYNGQVLPASHM